MQLPRERGPISGRVLETLRTGRDHVSTLAFGPDDVLTDPDAQLALWVLYELSYRGFEDVDPDLEWDTALIRLRRNLEKKLEAELRVAARPLVAELDPDGDVGEQLLALASSGHGPSPAAFLHRHATLEVLLDYLRERSIQQLKESDPQSFVLPRLSGASKVALAELQYDEYGGGRPERLHQQLYADALAAVGLDPAYGAYIDEVSAISLAMANVMSLFGFSRRLRGAAMGHLAVFEASSPVGSKKVAAGIERLGLPPTAAAYFHEHVEADSVHEQVASHDICGTLVAEEPELRDDVMFGAACCLHLDALSAQELMDRWDPPQLDEELAS
jgi:hypothetical protein